MLYVFPCFSVKTRGKSSNKRVKSVGKALYNIENVGIKEMKHNNQQ